MTPDLWRWILSYGMVAAGAFWLGRLSRCSLTVHYASEVHE